MIAASFGANDMYALLKLLQDGKFHSGEVLGSAMGLSRMAVWKRLQQLEQELDLRLHSVRGKGYRLAEPLSLLDEARHAELSLVDWPVQVYLESDSTNVEAMRQLQGGLRPPFVIMAERQTAGRGRRGRRWVSPFGCNLYFSLAWPVERGARELEGLSLVVGLAVRHVLQGFGLVRVGLKWPNDVLIDGKKIAGILLELVGDPADTCHVIIGIGINVNMHAVPETIDQPWTSMCMETAEQIDRNLLCARLCDALADWLSRHRTKGFSTLRQEWETAHAWQGRDVRLTSGNQAIEGKIMGVNERGALRLLVGGIEKTFSGGELSLRLSHDA
ncbi:BirA family biotin operon repressor/biotin-[acetyl-CoA-carboxylase] ligase [Azomonas macrocytogenes]|uniref:Bifunctional ligase/repressor BirA n=2 Tax=Azomonas macrocytogenes TaxID=69962 RepID=A0A839SYY2_AZOMA|nr:BirA family biotin operon repressor/biotin-[acetyl-CoA-carboxylase] ligase [Azomonas macrocytogenes]